MSCIYILKSNRKNTYLDRSNTESKYKILSSNKFILKSPKVISIIFKNIYPVYFKFKINGTRQLPVMS